MNPAICVAIHDVAPATWQACARLFDLLREVGDPPLTLLVVPDYHGCGAVDRARDFIDAMERRIGHGDELALHGYDHLDHGPPPRTPAAWWRRRVLTAGEGEFSTLSTEEAYARIARGLEMFERLHWHVAGFVPPAWLSSTGTFAALRRFSLRYTSTHTRLIDLLSGERYQSPCLTASPRSAWRRATSKIWLASMEGLTAQAPLIRVALHPADALHADILESWHGLLTRLLRMRRALTKSQALDECRNRAAVNSDSLIVEPSSANPISISACDTPARY